MAKQYGEGLRTARTHIVLVGLVERLRATQDPIGRPPWKPSTLYGAKPEKTIARIRKEIELALGSLEQDGPGAAARAFLEIAQASLDRYEDFVHDIASGDRAAWTWMPFAP